MIDRVATLRRGRPGDGLLQIDLAHQERGREATANIRKEFKNLPKK